MNKSDRKQLIQIKSREELKSWIFKNPKVFSDLTGLINTLEENGTDVYRITTTCSISKKNGYLGIRFTGYIALSN